MVNTIPTYLVCSTNQLFGMHFVIWCINNEYTISSNLKESLFSSAYFRLLLIFAF